MTPGDIVLGILGDLFRFPQNALCAFTGKYPPPRPVVQCDCPDVCNCCAQSECSEDCECWNNRDDEE
jgi:hypothetical protein